MWSPDVVSIAVVPNKIAKRKEGFNGERNSEARIETITVLVSACICGSPKEIAKKDWWPL